MYFCIFLYLSISERYDFSVCIVENRLTYIVIYSKFLNLGQINYYFTFIFENWPYINRHTYMKNLNPSDLWPKNLDLRNLDNHFKLNNGQEFGIFLHLHSWWYGVFLGDQKKQSNSNNGFDIQLPLYFTLTPIDYVVY